MSVRFKIADKASTTVVAKVLHALEDCGMKADELFPQQRRPALTRTYVIRSPKARVDSVRRALKPFGGEIEYVEGAIERRPTA